MELNCRVCLQASQVLVSIFEDVDQYQMNLCELLKICGDLEIDVNDSFPKYICQQCTRELLLVAEFREKCKQSKQLLLEKKISENSSQNLENLKPNNVESNNAPSDLELCDEDDVEDAENSKDLSREIRELENELLGTENKSEPFKHLCQICGAAFQQLHNFQRHMDRDHSVSFVCQRCQKSYATEQLFEEHSCIVEDVKETNQPSNKGRQPKKYICKICSKGLQSDFALKMHLRIHTGERPYQCEICSATFKTLSALHNHKNIHSQSPKVVLCKICNKGFSNQSNLNTHMLSVHTQLRPHVCYICTKAFARLETLQSHLSRHYSSTKRLYSVVD